VGFGSVPSPGAALGDGDGAARRPHLGQGQMRGAGGFEHFGLANGGGGRDNSGSFFEA